MKKNVEVFYFFTINDANRFKDRLNNIIPKITTTAELLDVGSQPDTLINIAFSQRGLTALGVLDSLNDTSFSGGQLADAAFLGDPGTDNWVPEFKGTSIHGLFLLASDSIDNINEEINNLQDNFDSSLSKQYSLQGQVRPGDQQGHEREFLLYSRDRKTIADIFFQTLVTWMASASPRSPALQVIPCQAKL